ncbi:SpoIIE family protein phosphatase [Streptomyces sp. NPDC047000]|uniref:SpoIIE family protein phosphatase n=1 Tax=Streptomyces sp. NPDC047000 TaxID=3155474 RepID=UPI0033C0C976
MSDVSAIPLGGEAGGPGDCVVPGEPVAPGGGPVAAGGAALDEALRAVLAATARRTGASAAGLYLIEDRAAALRLVALCGLPVEFTAPWQRLLLTAPVPVADAIRDDRLVWVGDQDEMTNRYPRTAAVLPYRFSLAAVPLTGARRCWGGVVLMFPADHPREITARERGHITAGAHGMARLVEDSPYPPSLPESPVPVPLGHPHPPLPAGTEQAAADCVERFPEGILALDLEGRITYADTTAAHLLGRRAERLLGLQPWQALPWLDDPVCEDRYRTAVVSRAPISFTASPPKGDPLIFRLHPDATGISVCVTRPGEQPPGSETLGTAPRPGVRATGRLYQLIHLAAALTQAVTVCDLVAVIADQILPAFGAQGLLLCSAEAGRLRITGHYGYPEEMIERFDGLPLGNDLLPAGYVMETGATVFFGSWDELAASYPQVPRISSSDAWAFLPLSVTGRPVGCCVLSYDHPHEFTRDERAVLIPLGGLLAQALDRVRLYDTQHGLAQELQRALLPHTLPKLEGLDVAARCLPAGHGVDVGGDFYDLLRLDDTTAAAVIGDVEGHSIASAALMGQVRTAIHAHATARATPDNVLSCTNRLLVDLDSELLVSCLYAQIDLARHEVAFASAGHVPPLLREGPHRARVLSPDPGPLLGVDPRSDYPVVTAPLPPGAVLALHTDGLVELPGADAARATDDLVRYLAGAGDTDPERLADGLIHRSWPVGQYTDDVTVLLLRAAGRPA